ncbi:cis-Golgi t-SNARE syntaxin [Phlyctochytrium planicorne]|nr:cis-Golgi t-SNARE syntaxin [Phlyctochytrium planicorne]
MKDRTQEFHAAVDSMLQRGLAAPYTINNSQERSKLLASSDSTPIPQSKSEFARAAATVAKEINATILKLHKLSQLARKKSLFDDRPLEINELIHVIKQDIAKVNRQISALSQHVQVSKNSGKMGNRQVEEHATNVVMSLQTRLASTSGEFKSVLEIRTQNIREQKSRRDQYSYAGTPNLMGSPNLSSAQPNSNSKNQPTSPNGTPSSTDVSSIFRPVSRSSDSPLYNPERKAPPGGDVVLDLGSGGPGPSSSGGQQQSLMLMNPANQNMEYLESRSNAIESIESTIAELGQIYQQFAQILTQQREMIQRIDDNVVDMEMNVSGAHDQLLKYFQNMSSNRWLMIRVFGVLIVFFLLFVLIT